jgi:CheY-like chemotaxis protein
MKILIVDDVATVRTVLRMALQSRGHQILEAVDGQEALAILAREKVDGVVSDILMPNVDGFRLCYEIRNRDELRHLPIVIVTKTYTTDADRKLALTAGADEYMLKPASADAIVDALLRHLHAPRTRVITDQSANHENGMLKQYSQSLVAKLEKRNIELEGALDLIKELNASLEQRVTERTAELTKALAQVKELSGLLPICSYCKRIRDDKNYWASVESYITHHSRAKFNYGFCPECFEKHVLPMLDEFDVAAPVAHEGGAAE